MTTLLLIVALIIALLFLYAIKGREWLKSQPWAQRFFAWIDPIELALFKKSEQVLAGRLLWLGGAIVTAYDAVGAYFSNLDLTPITTRVLDFLHVPQDLRGLTLSAFVTALGLMIVNLRKKVTKPLELVAVSDKAVAANPKVAEAIAMADATKTEAVNVVADAKAS
jgi:hypothetical protein